MEWALPPGQEHVQRVLNHPSGNLSIGTVGRLGPLPAPAGRLYGVPRGVDTRRLVGAGWTVAAKTTVGGLGALAGRSAQSLLDAELPLPAELPAELSGQVSACSDNAERCEVLRQAIEQLIRQRDPGWIRNARRTAAIAARAEQDRSIKRVGDLADAAGVSLRSLHRLFAEHVGTSPAWVIRRWRLIEALDRADAVRAVTDSDPSERPYVDWARLASELGYSDQPHLVRDMREHLGITPQQYLLAPT